MQSMPHDFLEDLAIKQEKGLVDALELMMVLLRIFPIGAFRLLESGREREGWGGDVLKNLMEKDA